MVRLLYELSVTYRGYLIIPFVGGSIAGEEIYSYALLSELGHRGQFHKATNPSEEFSGRVEDLLKIARVHIAQHSETDSDTDYFKHRYTYRNNLIIVLRQGKKVFYDHYPPSELTNIAAPKIFEGESECLTWIRQGIDFQHQPSSSYTEDPLT